MFEPFSDIIEVAMVITPMTRKVVLLKTTSGQFTEIWVNNKFQHILHNNDVFARTVQYIAAAELHNRGFKTKIEHNRLEVVFP